MPSLVTFKRRAASHGERDQEHSDENLNLLFAPNSVFEGSKFTGCAMNLANLSGVQLKEGFFTGCELVGAVARGANLECVVFVRCALVGMNFDGARLRGVTFKDCDLTGASFLGAQLHHEVLFDHCVMDDADLRFYESEEGAPSFVGTHLRGVSLNINCEFWNGTFDEVATADFGRLFARASQDEELIDLAKRRWGSAEYEKLDAYMRRPR